jgi:diaminopimelate epimerase
MHGLGNDFAIIEQVTNPVYLSTKQIQKMADRNTGIGFDQLIYIEAPLRPDVDFHYRVFNADGTEVEHCGNGARCLYRFVRNRRLTWKKTIKVSTETDTILEMTQASQGLVSVTMQEPQFSTEQIPRTQGNSNQLHGLEIAGKEFDVGLVSVGNPHCILLVDDIKRAPVVELGNQIRKHHWFPEQVNVGFMEVINPTQIKLRVFERGVGETLACGTGACAAIAVGRQQGWLDERVRVELKGGDLQLLWKGKDNQMIMTGPAETVFEGSINL